MTMFASRRPGLFAVAMLAAAILPGAAYAQSSPPPPRISDGAVKIGLILDMSGPYSDVTGAASAAAARMAVEDYGGKVLGAPIELLVEDHHNSADRALAIARDWFDKQHVDAIMDVSGSSEALLVQRFGDLRHKIVSLSAPAASRLSNEGCTATSIHYVSSTQVIARTLGASLVGKGDNTWFFITVDYSFGYDLEHDTAAIVEDRGGKVLGQARHPFNTRDFGSYLARAKDSEAKVIGLADAGTDTEAAIRQAAQLGMIPGPQVFAGLTLRLNGVQALGLPTAQGMMLSESFYWDLDDASRAWSKRFFERAKKMPNSLQAGLYSSLIHYLRAVAQAGTDDTDPVLKAMRDTPVDDFFAHNGRIRADGTLVHDMRVFQAKTPAESKEAWDDLKLVATMPGAEAFPPLSQSRCPLVKG